MTRSDPDGAVVLRLAGREQREPATSAPEAADLADRHDQMLRLAELFDDASARLRTWADLATEVVRHPDVHGTAAWSPATWARAEEEIRELASGRHGLLERSTELEADAVVLRATVGTYRWLDDLRATAFRAFGSITDRAGEYVAPHVRLGGAMVAAGLIETDALDRAGVASYLAELAAEIPELMDHVTTGGGLVESLQVRGLLTVGMLGQESGRSAAAGGLRAAGVDPLDIGWGAAVRDVAFDLDAPASGTTATPGTHASTPVTDAGAPTTAPPAGLADVLAHLSDPPGDGPARIVAVAPDRLLVVVTAGDLGPPRAPRPGGLRLVSGDRSGPAAAVAGAVRTAARATDATPQVLLLGRGVDGATAIEAATLLEGADDLVIAQVVTANAPRTHLARSTSATPLLSFEEHTDPVALLGSLLSASDEHRLTVVYDAAAAPDLPSPVAGGAAADRSEHPALLALVERWRQLGFLAPAARA